ncbi:hypothetical protein B0H10DRAFT_2209465 [Mycena sp. CBHHK59/15]|nr:hypothetical protein B0H10DRAFT_2209465 [Mycena sp. CBHHK59/15]
MPLRCGTRSCMRSTAPSTSTPCRHERGHRDRDRAIVSFAGNFSETEEECTVKAILQNLLWWSTSPSSRCGAFMLIGVLTRFWDPFVMELLRTPHTFMNSAAYESALVPVFDRLYAVAVRLEAILAPVLEPAGNGPMANSYWWFQIMRCRGSGITTGPSFIIISRGEGAPDAHANYFMVFGTMTEAPNKNQCLNVECKTQTGTHGTIRNIVTWVTIVTVDITAHHTSSRLITPSPPPLPVTGVLSNTLQSLLHARAVRLGRTTDAVSKVPPPHSSTSYDARPARRARHQRALGAANIYDA